jgi:hypothetical protein
MRTVPVAAWMGNAAAVVRGAWGAVTRRAAQSGESRTAIYQPAARVVQAVASAPASGSRSEDLWAAQERLKADHEALWPAWSETADLRESTQRERASAGSAMGLSRTQIVVLLAMVWPRRLGPSRATGGRGVPQSAQPSRGILAVLERAGQGVALVWGLDEIFCHRAPIWMGVEPISLAWLAGQRGPDRRGESWGKVIAHWPNLAQGIADGGQGLERGVTLAHDARHQAGAPESDAPAPLTMGRDGWHTQRELERGLQRVWTQGERQMETAAQADAKVEPAKRRGQDTRGLAGSAGRAWRQAERLCDEAVQAQEAVAQSQGALRWFDASGHLDPREQAQQALDEATKPLQGERWKQAKRMLSEARTLRHVDRLAAPLRVAVPEPRWRDALGHGWSLLKALKQAEGDQRVYWSQLVALSRVLCGQLCPDGQASSMQVDALLRQAVRASRAVDGANSVVRMPQGRPRHVSQGMLDLKRRYWNGRAFEAGKRKGRSPYELLGLQLPTSDWWQLLQRDPQELKPKLLT